MPLSAARSSALSKAADSSRLSGVPMPLLSLSPTAERSQPSADARPSAAATVTPAPPATRPATASPLLSGKEGGGASAGASGGEGGGVASIRSPSARGGSSWQWSTDEMATRWRRIGRALETGKFWIGKAGKEGSATHRHQSTRVTPPAMDVLTRRRGANAAHTQMGRGLPLPTIRVGQYPRI